MSVFGRGIVALAGFLVVGVLAVSGTRAQGEDLFLACGAIPGG